LYSDFLPRQDARRHGIPKSTSTRRRSRRQLFSTRQLQLFQNLAGHDMVWKGDSNDRLAKCLVTLIDDIDQRIPSRNKRNDGSIGDAAHRQRPSDHNPQIRQGSTGIVTALDVTHDPGAGFDAGAFAESLRESKDPRIKYVIFNGRIFSSTVTPWTWRSRNKGPGDHSEHVHVSVVADPQLYDSTKAWQFQLPQAVAGRESSFPPKLQLGDKGPAVVNLQSLLGIESDGVFGSETERAVRAFQESQNLVVDGIVGSHTWGVLMASSGARLAAAQGGGLAPAVMEQIVRLAGESDLSRFRWADRGVAPRGYIKGMAVTFAHVYAKLKSGDSAARAMAAMNSGNDDADALAWYDSKFRAAGMDNSVSGAATLRHLFVLLIGLGMRESSGKYFEGRDMSADNTDADTAEAGLFQMSWNARRASPELPKLFTAYSARPDGFLSIFREGAGEPDPSDLENVGTGEGVAFQRLCKSCPAFAVETAGVGLRVLRKHWGPINRREAELRPEADSLLQQVQGLVDAHEAIVRLPTPEGVPTVPSQPPPAADPRLLLTLFIMMLSKGKPMANDPAKPGQGADLVQLLLPLLLQSMLTGKQINITDVLSGVLTGRPTTSVLPGQPVTPLPPTPIATPSAQPAPQLSPQPLPPAIDLAALLVPLLYERLTGKPWPGASPSPAAEAPKPAETPTAAISKPSVQLSVGGLAISTILQALGVVGTPFGVGEAPTTTGTLATLIPIVTAAFGATGGFGSLLNIGRSLLGGLFNRPK
jgi:hypothetical protein